MIRLVENVVKSNVRCLVQSVNSVICGRPTSNLPCNAEKRYNRQNEKQRENQNKKQNEDHHDTGTTNSSAFVTFNFLPPSLLCAGLATFAGAHLSRLAPEWWREYGGGGGGGRLSRLLFSRPPAALAMRDAKVSSNKKDSDDRVAAALGASMEEACDLVNREGAAFARRGEWDRALECFRSAATEGHPPAQFNLGLYFHTVSVDLGRARALYRQAAAAGHAEAAYNLSTILLGEDRPEWEQHMQEAAARGLTNAQTFLGSFYFDRGDLAKARRYFGMGLASKETAETCSYWLGRCFEAEGALPLADLWYSQVLRAEGVLAEDCRRRLDRSKLRHSHSAAALRTLARDDFQEVRSRGAARFFVPEEEAEWRTEEEETEEAALKLRFQEKAPLRKSQSVARCLG